MNEGGGAIIFVHTHRKNAHHGKASHARQDSSRRHLCLRGNQRYFITKIHAHRQRKLLSQYDAKFSTDQRLHITGYHFLVNIGNGLFLARQYTMNHRSTDLAPMIEHALKFHLRGSTRNTRILLQLFL